MVVLALATEQVIPWVMVVSFFLNAKKKEIYFYWHSKLFSLLGGYNAYKPNYGGPGAYGGYPSASYGGAYPGVGYPGAIGGYPAVGGYGYNGGFGGKTQNKSHLYKDNY